MAKPELGSKHKCQNCGTKYFDLNKDPVVCPKCGEVQEISVAAPSSAARAAPRSAPARDEDETTNDDGAEVVSLEDADQTEDGQVQAATNDDDADVESDDSSNDDDTFLEEEEDDDGNVSDLIDGDIENDEER